MANKIVKSLALAGGLGLVIGIGSGRRRPGEVSPERNLPEQTPSPEPVLDRLERMELRISAMEARPANEADPIVQRQAEEIEALQMQLREHRQKVANEIASIEKRFADVTKAIPAALESIITARAEDLRAHLRAEMQQAISSSLTKFERAIDDRVAERIETLENALLNQSGIVTALSQRAVETDLNLQRLIAAVERLCERAGAAPPSQQEASIGDLPFQKELSEALKRQPDAPAQGLTPQFGPRIVKEDDDLARRQRIPLTRL